MTDTAHILIGSDHDVVTARMKARDMAKLLGFGSIDQARITTTVSELARNILLYAGTGAVNLRKIKHNGRSGLEIVCTDSGPGIEDIHAVMQDGYSTSGGVGMGLPGAKRLMDDFNIWSQPGMVHESPV